MNNSIIDRLKEISRECYKILCNCTDALEKTTKENFNINHKLTKRNFENFLKKINSNDNKLDAEDYLIENLREIKEIFGNIIKENFPFYTDYDISFSMCHGNITVIVSVSYYYMGKKEYYDDIVPLNNKYLEKNIRCFESSLIDIRKDIISYLGNEIQQKFLRKC